MSYTRISKIALIILIIFCFFQKPVLALESEKTTPGSFFNVHIKPALCFITSRFDKSCNSIASINKKRVLGAQTTNNNQGFARELYCSLFWKRDPTCIDNLKNSISENNKDSEQNIVAQSVKTTNGLTTLQIQAFKGDKGDQGSQGTPGINGSNGALGLQGIKGDKGDQGISGNGGAKGDKGDKGDQGNSGPTYSAGSGLTLSGTTFSVGVLGVSNGATGISSYSLGDILYANSTSTLAALNADSDGKVLKLASGVPTWGDDNGGTSYVASEQGLHLDSGTGTFSLALDSSSLSTSLSGLKISSGYTGQTSINTLGTVTTGTWHGNVLGIAYGGTGLATTPTNGQLLIGNGTGYSLANITGTDGVTITNGSGSVAIGLAITSAPTITSVSGNDYLPIYTSGDETRKKITYNDLFAGVLGALNYQGVWNANSNSPTLVNGDCTSGNKGKYYVVNVAGSTSLGGISSWGVGDWAVCNGTSWDQILNTNAIASVFGRTGTIIAQNGDYTGSQITNTPAGNIAGITVQGAINELDTEKEAAITAGTTGQYYRGDKSWQTLDTAAVSENASALYFTNARARSSLSSSATGLSYNNSTGIFALTSGYVIPTTTSTSDWDTAYSWGNHASAGYLTSVNFSQIQNGAGVYMNYKPNNTACTVNQVLKYSVTNSRWECGDDNNTNLAGSNLTLAGDRALVLDGHSLTFDGASDVVINDNGNTTIGGDLTVTGDDLYMATNTLGALLVADGTNFNPVVLSGDASVAASGALTINYATAQSADSTHKGFLTASDWSTFNSKQAALGFTPENVANKSIDTGLGTSDVYYPTQNAVKTYVDNRATGLNWQNPVELINVIGDASSPVSPVSNDAYIINTGGNTGAWASFAAGDLVQYQSSAWVKIKSMVVGDRFGVAFKSSTTPSGSMTGKLNYKAQITGGTPGAFTYTFTAPANNDALFVQNTNAYYHNVSFTYSSTLTSWVQLSASVNFVFGNGLTTSGTNISLGPLTSDWTQSGAFDINTAGDISINGADLKTTASTATLFNTNATTLSVGGAATTVNLGAAGATLAGPGALTIKSGDTTALTIDSGTTGGLNLGTGNNAKTINLGTGTAGNTINIGTNNTTADAINIGSALDSFALSSTGLKVTSLGALTGVASINTITASATGLTFAGAGTISSTGVNTMTIDSGTTGAVNIGTGANAKVVTLGSTNTSASTAINSGTGGIAVLTGTSGALSLTTGTTGTVTLDSGTTGAVNVGTGSNAKTVTLGSLNTTATTNINSGTGGLTLLTGTSGNLSLTTGTTGTATLDSGTSGDVNVGTNANAKTVTIGNSTGATTVNINTGTGGLTLTTATTGAVSLKSGTTGAVTLDSGTTGSVNIGNGTNAKTVTIGNSTGATAVNITSGTGGISLLTTTSGNLSLTSGSTGSVTLDSGTTGSVNIGNGANAKTITIGNGTSATALNFTSGTGAQTHTSSNATGTTTASAFVFNPNAITSGTGLYLSSSTLTSGLLMDLQVSGTAAAANQTGLNILTTGVTATNGITTYGAQISNTHTNATSGTNVALYLNASGATTANYGLIVNSGNVGIGTTTPSRTLDVTGDWGGNVVTTSTTNSGTTSTISTRALAYYVQSSDTTGTCATATKTFNITGLSATEGSYAYIVSKAIDAGCNSGTLTLTVSINGTTISTVANANTNGTVTENYIVAFINGAWRILGTPSTADGADLAEMYSTNDGSLEAGDVVSLDSSLKSGVKKSEGVNDRGLMGIVSSVPAMVIGEASGEGVTAVPIALSGRVPVKVSTENGPIKAGDQLTTSSIAGVAMKATKAGSIIGMAMSDYGNSGKQGLILAFVKTGYFNGENTLTTSVSDGQDSGQVILGQLMNGTLTNPKASTPSEIFTDRVIAGLEIVTPKITTDELITNKIKVTQIEGLKDFVLNVASSSATPDTISNNLIAEAIIKVFNSVAEFFDKVIFHGEVIFLGRATFNNDAAGFAVINAGATEVEVKFDQEYQNTPIITASPDTAVLYSIKETDTKGFKIKLTKTENEDIKFSWVATAVKDAKTSVGKVSIPIPTLTPASTNSGEPSATPTVFLIPTIESANSDASQSANPSILP